MVYTTFIRSNFVLKLLVSLGLLILLSGAAEAQITKTTDGVTPPGLAPGAPAGAYPLSESENINLYNGHVSFTLPITQKGRGGANISIPIRISPKPWTVKHQRVEVPNPHPLPPGTMQDIYNAEPSWWNDTDSRPILPGGRMVGRYSTEDVVDCSGTLYSMRTNTRLTFTAPDGTEYNLIDKEKGGSPRIDTCSFSVSGYRGSVFVTSDGTSATFYSQSAIADVINASDPQWMYASTTFYPTGYLMLQDGTRYDISDGYVTRMRDRNGNEVRYQPIINIGIVGWTITDSLNRQIVINYDVNDGPTYGVVDRITLKGFGGADRYIRISYNFTDNWLRTTQPTDPTSPWTIQQLFPELDNSEGEPGGPLKVSTIWLPDGRSYKFKYNVYHELARVELPTGGAIEYDYSGGEPNGTSSGVIGDYLVTRYPAGSSVPLIGIYRRLVERRVYSGLSISTLVGETTYSKPVTVDAGLPTISSNLLVEQWTPGGSACLARSKHHFQRSAYYSQLRESGAGAEDLGESREKRTEARDTTPSMTELRRVEHTWGYGSFVPNDNYGIPVPINPRIDETKTTLLDANLVSKQRFIYDQYNNQTDVYEHDYGAGAPPTHATRHTHTDYLTTNPVNQVNYATDTNIHIRNLPSQQIVYAVNPANGAETWMAQTKYEYDRYDASANHAALVNRSNISGFDSGFTTSYTTRGNATQVDRWLNSGGSSLVNSWAQYDIAGNAVKAIDAKGYAAIFDFSDRFGSPDDDARQNTPPTNPNWLNGQTTFAFATKITNALGHEAYTQFDYFIGKPVNSEDANGIVSSVAYSDNLDRPTQAIQARYKVGSGVTSARRQTLFAYNDKSVPEFGNPPRSITTISDKDVFGESTNGNGIKSLALYDGLGRTWRGASYEGNTGGGNTWAISDTQFDALGRVWQVSNPYRAADPSSASPPSGTWTATTYDALSRVKTVQTPDTAVVTTDYNGNAVTVTDQAGKQRRSLTDGLGRLIRVDEPNGCNNCLGSVSSPLQPTSYVYDALGNLRQAQQGSQNRYFMYDSLSRLIRAKNPEQNANGSIALTDPVTGNSQWSMAYSYDLNGNLLTRVDSRDVTTTYGYDNLNRNTAVSYSDGVTPGVNRYYDGAISNGKGRLHYSISYNSHPISGYAYSITQINGYDAMGRVSSQQQGFLNSAGTQWYYYPVSRTYNLAGNVLTQNYPSNRTTTYGYNTAAQLTSFTGTLGDGASRNYATGMTYTPAGLMSRETFGMQAATLYHNLHYNNRQQLVDIRVGDSSTDEWNWSRGALIYYYGTTARDSWNAFANSADNNGNVLRQVNYVPLSGGGYVIPQLDDYGYDALNRNTSVTEAQQNSSGGWTFNLFTQNFGYDRWGNRTVSCAPCQPGVTNDTFAIDTATNRITARNGMGMTYDAAGNQTYDTLGNRWFDGENRMYKAVQSGTTSHYVYDADGKRVRRIIGSTETWMVYGMDGELIAEYAANGSAGSPQKEYGYRGGQMLIVAQTSPLEIRWTVTDHLGTPRMNIRGTGTDGGLLASVTRHDYLPFGEELLAGVGIRSSSYGYEPPSDGVRQKFGYAYERDNETGLDFAQARYFSGIQGRFTSPDAPFADQFEGDPQSWNLYTFVRNNPGVLIDPSGYYTCRPDGSCVGDFDGEKHGKLYWNKENQLWESKKEYQSRLNARIDWLVERTYLNYMHPNLFRNGGINPGNVRNIPTGEVPQIVPIVSGYRDFANSQFGAGLMIITPLPGPKIALAARLVGLSRGFHSFTALKRFLGPAGEGYAWHHIVEQTASNVARFGPDAVHSLDNVVRLPSGAGSIHARLSGFYSSIQPAVTGSTTMTVRQWSSTQSFQQQYEFGIKVLQSFGVKL